jgi:hypothetical protein
VDAYHRRDPLGMIGNGIATGLGTVGSVQSGRGLWGDLTGGGRLGITGDCAPNPVVPGSYLAEKAPKQVTPGVQVLEGHYVNDLGRVEPWRAHYDEYGRQVGRTDFNAGNKAQGIPDVHHHTYEYNARYRHGRETQAHVPGEYRP